jgi:hypothetical protein
MNTLAQSVFIVDRDNWAMAALIKPIGKKRREQNGNKGGGKGEERQMAK